MSEISTHETHVGSTPHSPHTWWEYRPRHDMAPLPEGPWNDEPDDTQWVYLTYPCRVLRGPAGALCGYVALPPGHPWLDGDYESIDCTVHGGLTYMHDNVVGFDCSHAGDVRPALMTYYEKASLGSWQEQYRDRAYVMNEVEDLVRQALRAEMGIENPP